MALIILLCQSRKCWSEITKFQLYSYIWNFMNLSIFTPHYKLNSEITWLPELYHKYLKTGEWQIICVQSCLTCNHLGNRCYLAVLLYTLVGRESVNSVSNFSKEDRTHSWAIWSCVCVCVCVCVQTRTFPLLMSLMVSNYLSTQYDQDWKLVWWYYSYILLKPTHA